MRLLTSILLSLALLAVIQSCFTYRHYAKKDSQLDGVFFGVPPASATSSSRLESSVANVYALWGLVPYSDDSTRATTTIMASAAGHSTVYIYSLTTQTSFLDGFVNVIALYYTLGLGGLVINMRSADIKGAVCPLGNPADPRPAGTFVYSCSEGMHGADIPPTIRPTPTSIYAATRGQ